MVAAAMPTVADQLGGLALYSWVFSAYLLTSTVSIPLWGKLSDLYGRRRFYLWSVGLFLVGSALSGAAQTMPQLILFRALQGFGAGGLVPLGMSVLADLYTLEERGRMQGLLSGVWGVASLVGPVTGGDITALFSWRWVFYLNIPFGIATAVAAAVQDASDPVAADMVRGIHRAFWLAAIMSGVAVIPALRIPGGLPADLVHPDRAVSTRLRQPDSEFTVATPST